MTRQEHLLVTVMEECDEVSQRCAKALRFGMEQIQQDADDKPEQNPGMLRNDERIRLEYHDLVAVMEMLGIKPNGLSLIEAKKQKVERYLMLSSRLGKLE